MKRLALVALALAVAAPTLAADTYKIDPAHTQAAFAVKHLLISTVRGDFGKTAGTAVIDDKDPGKSSVDVTIDVGSLNTRDEKRDAHLKSPDFFDAAKYPTITFRSTKVVKSGEHLMVTGDLTMKGVTKSVVLQVSGPTAITKDPMGNERRGAEATVKLNRKDFGVSYGPNAVVSDDVSITIDAELIKDQPKK